MSQSATFLMIILDPIPDRIIIFYFNEMAQLNPAWELQGAIDVASMSDGFQRILFYFFALISFISLVSIFVGIWQLAGNDKSSPKKAIMSLLMGIFGGVFTGFTTCLPLIL